MNQTLHLNYVHSLHSQKHPEYLRNSTLYYYYTRKRANSETIYEPDELFNESRFSQTRKAFLTKKKTLTLAKALSQCAKLMNGLSTKLLVCLGIMFVYIFTPKSLLRKTERFEKNREIRSWLSFHTEMK